MRLEKSVFTTEGADYCPLGVYSPAYLKKDTQSEL